MFQLAGLLIFFGFGSVVLYYLDYEFKILAWLSEYQPFAGVVIGVIGLAVLVLAFWLKSRDPDAGDAQEQPAYGGAQGGPMPAAPAPWTGPNPQQAYYRSAPGQPPAGPYSAQQPPQQPQFPGQQPSYSGQQPSYPGQQPVPQPRYTVPPQPQAPYSGGQYAPPAQPGSYPPPPYPHYPVNGTAQPMQPPYGGPSAPPPR